MEIEITTATDKASEKAPGANSRYAIPTAAPTDTGHRPPIQKTLQRYCSLSLGFATVAGAIMIFAGFRPLGKGLILGAVFSVVNFLLMASALPMSIKPGRRKPFLFSLGSIYLRYALMAVPLVMAFKQESFAVSTVAVGLFMVQLTILGDQLWGRLRNSAKVK